VEVIHQAGVFTAGDLMFGSDQSDNNFAIQGNCNSGGGGCPFVDVLTEDGWREENSILARSPGGELKPDVYRLTSAPRIESDGSLRIRIREDERERTRLSAARLVVVDRDPDQRAAIVDGRIVLARRVPAWRVRSGSGADVTSVVTLEGGAGYRTAPGELLDVELLPEDPGAGGGEGGTGGTEIGGIVMDGGGKEFENTTPVAGYGDAYDRKLLDATGIVIERPGEKGGWSAGAHLYPRAHFGELASRAGSRVRLRSLGRHDLRAIGWLRVESPEPERAVASLAKAEHTRLGDVKATLASENDELTLETGESLELTFRPGAIPDGKVRDYFLVTHGVYTTLAPGTPAVAAAQPKKLELGAARPNPTSSTVRFSYSLPVRDRVSVDIFDTAGRLIRSLVSETREAGEHEAIWDLQDRAGHRVQGGMYFCRMEVGRWKQQRKVAVTE
jgi:hypothetical protein